MREDQMISNEVIRPGKARPILLLPLLDEESDLWHRRDRRAPLPILSDLEPHGAAWLLRPGTVAFRLVVSTWSQDSLVPGGRISAVVECDVACGTLSLSVDRPSVCFVIEAKARARGSLTAHGSRLCGFPSVVTWLAVAGATSGARPSLDGEEEVNDGLCLGLQVS